jgi:2-methylcitrate dehydratase PrpD
VARTRVSVLDEFTRRYPAAWPARVTLGLRDGSSIEGASDYPCGHPENPVETGQLEGKLVALVEPRLGRDAAMAALAAMDGLARASDMAGIFPAILPTHVTSA